MKRPTKKRGGVVSSIAVEDEQEHADLLAVFVSDIESLQEAFSKSPDRGPMTFNQRWVELISGSLDRAARYARQSANLYTDQKTKRIDALEARLAVLEDQVGSGAPLKYAGVYQRPLSYRQGAVVTMNGSAWVALKDAPAGSQPGDGQTWQLMVKHGRDAKLRCPGRGL